METNDEKLENKERVDMFTTLHEHELKVKVRERDDRERESEIEPFVSFRESDQETSLNIYHI